MENKKLKDRIDKQKAKLENTKKEIEPEIYIKDLEMKNRLLEKLKKPENEKDLLTNEKNIERNKIEFGKKGKIIGEIELIKKFLERNLLERMNPNQINSFDNNDNQNQKSQQLNQILRANFSFILIKAPLLR